MRRGRKAQPPGRSKARPTEHKPAGGPPEDDRALWQAFVKQIDPLTLKGRVADAPPALFDEIVRREAAKGQRETAPTVAPVEKGRRAGPATPRSLPIPITAPRAAGGHDAIDSKEVRRIGKGRSHIDARIDLHGMRQHEAHAALRVFLFRAAARGHRMVLVITGKGGAAGDGAGAGRAPGETFGAFVNEAQPVRGVLRRNVPIWLGQADLAPMIVGFTTAHLKHGGDGALYVQLRRKG